MLCSKVRQLNPFLTHSDTYADCTGTRSFCMCWGFDHASRLAFLGFAKCFETHAASPPSELVEADHRWSMWLTSTSEQSLVAATWWANDVIRALRAAVPCSKKCGWFDMHLALGFLKSLQGILEAPYLQSHLSIIIEHFSAYAVALSHWSGCMLKPTRRIQRHVSVESCGLEGINDADCAWAFRTR